MLYHPRIVGVHDRGEFHGQLWISMDYVDGTDTALKKANDRCEAVICLVSRNWDASAECRTEYRTAEDRGKPIFPVRLEPTCGQDITSEWQRCDLFGDGPKTTVPIDGARVSEFLTDGLERLQTVVCGPPELRRIRSPGHRQETLIVRRIAGGNHWKQWMPPCTSGAMPRSTGR